MPKKLTIEYVREFVKEKTNGECEVISSEYINSDAPLLIRCRCGNEFERTFHKLRDREIMCLKCSNELLSKNQRKKIDEVISTINSTGCEYISGEYSNNKSILTIRCRCGRIFKKSFAKFCSGQNRCPDCGKDSLRHSKTKYSLDDVKNKLSENGYCILNEDEYTDCTSKMVCKCRRGHVFEMTFFTFLAGHAGCKKCANIENGGHNHWNYRNGKSDVKEALRHCIYSWKKELKRMYGGKCAVTSAKTNIVVHHLVDFNKLLEEASRESGVPVFDKISDYDNYGDFVKLKEALLKKHTFDIGIVISRRVHSKFHSNYTGYATPENFDDFLRKYYNTSLKEVKKDIDDE